MNILLFHQHFNTPLQGGAIRSYYLATALVTKGHRVVVITSTSESKRRIETVDGIEVVYLPIAYNNRFSFWARSWSFARFVIAAIRAGSAYSNFDTCYAISAPLTVAICARWMKWRYSIPYWFEVGDLWPDAPIELGFIKNPITKRLLLAFERSTYRRAVGVVALSEPIRQAILSKVPGTRVELIHNMSDCTFYKPVQRETTIEERFRAKDKFVISYLGALGMANGLEQLLQCAEECLKAAIPVSFIICGDGAMQGRLKEQVQAKALTNVSLTGFVNRDGVREIMSITDAVFVSYLPAAILETGCPNKYFDGLAAGKLIIVNFGGWIRQEIEATNCGFYVNPANPGELVEKLRPYLADRSRLHKAQLQSRQLAESRYSREAIGDRFAQLFVKS